MNTPSQLYRRSANTMPQEIEPQEYPGHYIVCFVSEPGTIRIVGNQCFVSSTVVHDHVGLDEVDDGVFDVFYRFYHICRYDVRENRVKDVMSRVPAVQPQLEVRPRVLPMS
jgi:putative transposase